VEAVEGDEGAVGSVLAGDPFGIVEGEGSGVDGDRFADVEHFFRGVGGVDGEGDGGVSLGEGGGREGEAGGEGAETETADRNHTSAPGKYLYAGHHTGTRTAFSVQR
jgi:hypothetical protein